jgi:DNA-binding NarL/FixJ family response regulator
LRTSRCGAHCFASAFEIKHPSSRLLAAEENFLSQESRLNPTLIKRIIVVEDFVAFRRLLCSILGKREDLQVICEVSDGLEAVQKAKELKTDLILLDIGLPKLNGLEAAREILKFAPESKIIFVSRQSFPELVQEALSLGAQGYVEKTRLGSDLLAAVEAVLDGRQFVSKGLQITPGST